MKKILNIAWKDLIVIIRDPGALVLMLGAPFVLTLGMGLVTGAFSSSSGSGLADIPVIIVNEDGGQLGQALTEVFLSEELADLLEPETAVSAAAARQQVDNNDIAAVVIIPAGFTESIIPSEPGSQPAAAAIEVYSSPGRPISASVVQSIVIDFVTQVDTGIASVQVTIQQMALNGRLDPTDPQQITAIGQEMGQQLLAGEQSVVPLIDIRQETAVSPTDDDDNPLTYFAPSMAVAFLMYTVALGGRSILAEREEGTLARLLASPTSITQVMSGKVSGIFLSGAAQVSVLIIASSLLFQLRWGSPAAVALLIAATAAAATGWGLLVAAISDRPGQVSSYGTALMLIFGILGGSFVQLNYQGALGWLSKITPNAWAISGFTTLGGGGSLSDIIPDLLALLLMAVILFGVSVTVFRRRSGSFA